MAGRVQGVGFRYFALGEARRLGVTGWVRNEPDGSVLVHAEGNETQLQQVEDALRRGPSYGRVDSLTVRRLPPSGTFRSFTVDY